MDKSPFRRGNDARHQILSNHKPDANAKLAFHGTITQLQDLVLLTGDYGEWADKPNGIWRYCSEDGGGLNWSSTRGTLWFDGPAKGRARLQRIVEAAVQSQVRE
jgi:hypothetical protein